MTVLQCDGLENGIIEAGVKAKVIVTMLTSAFVMVSSLFVLIGLIYIIMQNTGFFIILFAQKVTCPDV